MSLTGAAVVVLVVCTHSEEDCVRCCLPAINDHSVIVHTRTKSQNPYS
jgi:hypothetical protein